MKSRLIILAIAALTAIAAPATASALSIPQAARAVARFGLDTQRTGPATQYAAQNCARLSWRSARCDLISSGYLAFPTEIVTSYGITVTVVGRGALLVYDPYITGWSELQTLGSSAAR